MARVFDPGSRQSIRSFGKAAGPRWFDPSTPIRRRWKRAARLAVGAAMAGVVWLGGSGDDQVWAVVPGLVGLGLGALVPAALFGAQKPSLVCADCGAVGWPEDIKATGGNCPRCGSDRFQQAGRRAEESDSDDGTILMGSLICSGAYDDSGGSSDSDSGGDGGGGDGGGGD